MPHCATHEARYQTVAATVDNAALPPCTDLSRTPGCESSGVRVYYCSYQALAIDQGSADAAHGIMVNSRHSQAQYAIMG